MSFEEHIVEKDVTLFRNISKGAQVANMRGEDKICQTGREESSSGGE